MLRRNNLECPAAAALASPPVVPVDTTEIHRMLTKLCVALDVEEADEKYGLNDHVCLCASAN